MLTEKINIVSGDYSCGIKKAAEILKCGGIVAIPTETVYGLAASAYDADAISRVFKAKGRPQDNPLIVHISDIEMLKTVARDIPEAAYECAGRFWPGPFTMVLKRAKGIDPSVSAGLDTVAVRMPSSKAAHDIIAVSNIPLAAPSANLSGSPSPTTAAHTLSDLDGRVDAIVIGEDCNVGVESTVISLCTDTPRLLRPGAVTAEELKQILPNIIIDKAVLSQPEKGERVSSPGMKYKHYAPKTEAYLVEADTEKFAALVNGEPNSAAICFTEDEKLISCKKIVYGTDTDERTLAHDVFSALRAADGLGVEKIFIHAPSKSGVGLAVYNRLIRAAAFRVIKL